MSGTVVTYNGVTLYNVHTRQWDQEVRYDDSGTDALYMTFRMKFEGILHRLNNYFPNEDDPPSFVTSSLTSDGIKASMPIQYEAVKGRILAPRAPLYVALDGIPFFMCLPCPSSPGEMTTAHDVDNGPKPKAFRVLQIIGSKCLRVAFEIECAKLICTAGAVSATPVVLNNRWSIEEAMDEANFITRTVTGTMTLSTAAATTKAVSKYLVVPGLEKGFRRAGINFSVDKTGLKCDYVITDRQVHTSAPWPATKMNARHTQSTNDGINMTSEVHVELEGPPHADKKLLIARAMQIVDAKLNFAQMIGSTTHPQYNTRYFPELISITDHIGDRNRVEATVRFLESPGKGSDGETLDPASMFGNLRKNLGSPLKINATPDGFTSGGYQYNPGISHGPAYYGYYPPQGEAPYGTVRNPLAYMMLQCYLQKPCLDVHGIAKWPGREIQTPLVPEPEKTKEPPETEDDTEVTEYQDGDLPAAPPDADKWSDGAKAAVCTYATATSRYVTNENRVQLPSANGKTKTFKLGSPVCKRVIDVDVERVGDWPQIPKPEDEYTDGELHGTLLCNWTESHPPGLTADGTTPIHRISAHYEYAMDRPPRLDESYRVGVAPQTSFKKDDAVAKFNPAVAYANKDLNV